MAAKSRKDKNKQSLSVVNKKAYHNYELVEKFEAGIMLLGTEVKSLRAGSMTLKDSYADVENGEMRLVGAHISPYDKGNIHNHDPERPRRLLMHKREIIRLGAKVAEKGLTLVPLRVYFKNGRAKIEIGLCRGKHTVDKRRALRERDIKRETERLVSAARRR